MTIYQQTIYIYIYNGTTLYTISKHEAESKSHMCVVKGFSFTGNPNTHWNTCGHLWDRPVSLGIKKEPSRDPHVQINCRMCDVCLQLLLEKFAQFCCPRFSIKFQLQSGWIPRKYGYEYVWMISGPKFKRFRNRTTTWIYIRVICAAVRPLSESCCSSIISLVRCRWPWSQASVAKPLVGHNDAAQARECYRFAWAACHEVITFAPLSRQCRTSLQGMAIDHWSTVVVTYWPCLWTASTARC